MTMRLHLRLPSDGLADIQSNLLPRVYSCERLHGVLDVSTGNGSEPLFDAAEITFEGNMTSFIHNAIYNDGASWVAKKQLVHLTNTQPSSDFHASTSENPEKGTFHTSFYFDIPAAATDLLSHDQFQRFDLSAESTLIPPTASLRKAYAAGQGPADRGDGISGTCEIVYQIRARLLLHNRVVAETVRKVQLVPITEPAPPLDITDFPGEYEPYCNTSVINFFKLKRRGQLSVSIAEPRPFTLSPSEPASSATTKMILRFRYRQPSESAAPDLTECTVSSGLEATTHFSVVPLSSALSKREAARLQNVAEQEWKAKPYVRKLKLSNWQRVGEDCEDKCTVWEATTTVLVSPQLDNSAYLLPTFRSPYVSRRYALSLKVKLRSQKDHLAHLTLGLRTPVQVLYARPAKGALAKNSDGPLSLTGCEGCDNVDDVLEGIKGKFDFDELPMYTIPLSCR